MFVLLDLEWIETFSEQKYITQLAAIKVDTAWKEQARFEAVLSPIGLKKFDSTHIALTGYSLDAFQNGETEKSALNRLASWLQDDDVICVWNHSLREILREIWYDAFHSYMSYPILCANHKVYRSVQNGDDTPCSLYSIADAIGLSIDIPRHCSKNDVVIMWKLFTKIGLSQKKLRQESAKDEKYDSVQRNREIILKTQYNFIFTPQSDVFHTKKCPCMLNAKKIEGSMYYATAARKRRPCKICKPKFDPRSSIRDEIGEKEKQKENIESSIDYKEIIRVRVLGGEFIEICRGKIVGCCHNILHPGKMTKTIMEEHDCLGKQCKFFEKYEDSPFWIEREKKLLAKIKEKQRRKEEKANLLAKEELMIELRDNFQMYANSTDSKMDIIRVECLNLNTYKLFYVSDNHFADGNRFPEFLAAVKEKYARYRIILCHIKDVDGHFVTRDEYYARKR